MMRARIVRKDRRRANLSGRHAPVVLLMTPLGAISLEPAL
jgi:hypothetical protein